MKKFEFTERDREEVFKLLKSSVMGARNYLSQLLESKDYEGFFTEIKNLVRNSGRSNMISIDEIEKLIVKYGKKS